MLSERILEHLPALEFEADAIEASVVISRGFESVGGETCLLLARGRLWLFERGSILGPFEAIDLDASQAPRFEERGFESFVTFESPSRGALELEIPMLQKEELQAFLEQLGQAPASSPSPPSPSPPGPSQVVPPEALDREPEPALVEEVEEAPKQPALPPKASPEPTPPRPASTKPKYKPNVSRSALTHQTRTELTGPTKTGSGDTGVHLAEFLSQDARKKLAFAMTFFVVVISITMLSAASNGNFWFTTIFTSIVGLFVWSTLSSLFGLDSDELKPDCAVCFKEAEHEDGILLSLFEKGVELEEGIGRPYVCSHCGFRSASLLLPEHAQLRRLVESIQARSSRAAMAQMWCYMGSITDESDERIIYACSLFEPDYDDDLEPDYRYQKGYGEVLESLEWVETKLVKRHPESWRRWLQGEEPEEVFPDWPDLLEPLSKKQLDESYEWLEQKSKEIRAELKPHRDEILRISADFTRHYPLEKA